MPKKIAKEPLLFVDTMFKGCHVEEQSVFMTPQKAPKTIANENYVHTFDSLDKPNDVQAIKTDREFETTIDFLEDDEQEIDVSVYETVNIMVDSVGIEGEYLKDFDVFEDDITFPLTSGTIEREVEEEDEEFVLVSDTINSTAAIRNELNETQNELLGFIEEIVAQSSLMKSPVVQIIKKNGAVMSGKIVKLEEQIVVLDNFMDDYQSVHLSEVEGIRILHL